MLKNSANPANEGIKPVVMEIICNDLTTEVIISRPDENSRPEDKLYSIEDSRQDSYACLLRLVKFGRNLVGSTAINAVGIMVDNSTVRARRLGASLAMADIAEIAGLTDYQTVANSRLTDGFGRHLSKKELNDNVDLEWNNNGFEAVSTADGLQPFASIPRDVSAIPRPALYMIGREALAKTASILVGSAAYRESEARVPIAA